MKRVKQLGKLSAVLGLTGVGLYHWNDSARKEMRARYFQTEWHMLHFSNSELPRLLGSVGGRILGVGPHAGHLVQHLPKGVMLDYTGVLGEVNPTLKAVGEDVSASAGWPTPYLLTIEDSPIEDFLKTQRDASYDAVVMVRVLGSTESSSARDRVLLRELYRVLGRGGRLFFVERANGVDMFKELSIQRMDMEMWSAGKAPVMWPETGEAPWGVSQHVAGIAHKK